VICAPTLTPICESNLYESPWVIEILYVTRNVAEPFEKVGPVPQLVHTEEYTEVLELPTNVPAVASRVLPFTAIVMFACC